MCKARIRGPEVAPKRRRSLLPTTPGATRRRGLNQGSPGVHPGAVAESCARPKDAMNAAGSTSESDVVEGRNERGREHSEEQGGGWTQGTRPKELRIARW